MANHYSASQWRTWIDAFGQSDLTVVKFCESIGVSVNTYYRWRQRLQNESIPAFTPVAEFVSVALPAGQVDTHRATLTLMALLTCLMMCLPWSGILEAPTSPLAHRK